MYLTCIAPNDPRDRLLATSQVFEGSPTLEVGTMRMSIMTSTSKIQGGTSGGRDEVPGPVRNPEIPHWVKVRANHGRTDEPDGQCHTCHRLPNSSASSTVIESQL